jgi:hypothetical protein
MRLQIAAASLLPNDGKQGLAVVAVTGLRDAQAGAVSAILGRCVKALGLPEPQSLRFAVPDITADVVVMADAWLIHGVGYREASALVVIAAAAVAHKAGDELHAAVARDWWLREAVAGRVAPKKEQLGRWLRQAAAHGLHLEPGAPEDLRALEQMAALAVKRAAKAAGLDGQLFPSR